MRSQSIGGVMARIVPAILVVQLEKWKRFGAILPWRSTKS